MLRKIIAIGILLLPLAAFAQLLVPQGGSGLNVVPPGYVVTGSTTLRFVAKQLVAGSNVSISSTTDAITISATAGGGGASDWIQNYTFNGLALTPSTTIPTWFKAPVYASSTAIFNGFVYLNQASTTATSTALLINTKTQYSTSTLIFDPLVVGGPIMMTSGWRKAECGPGTSPVVSDTSATVPPPCSGWMFHEAVTAVWSPSVLNGMFYSILSSSAGKDNGGSLSVGATAFALTGSSSPLILDWVGTVSRTLLISTTTPTHLLGFSNFSAGSATFPYSDLGCYLLASSTVANYLAVCRTSASGANTTTVDTGISTTTMDYRLSMGLRPIEWRLTLTAERFTVFAVVNGNAGVRAVITTHLPVSVSSIAVHPIFKTMHGQGHTGTYQINFYREPIFYWKDLPWTR